MAFKLSSPAFGDGADIPARHTCDGGDTSPRLTWSDVPDRTESLALIMDDPDAPRGVFTHWIVYNLAPAAGEIGEGATPKSQGRNSFGRTGYGGPCPPIPDPAHRYRFTLHALDVSAIALENGTREELLARIAGHVLGTTLLVGRYRRQQS
jgi:Raf kinase inhibitor-like YbhB/YbcL family protein